MTGIQCQFLVLRPGWWCQVWSLGQSTSSVCWRKTNWAQAHSAKLWPSTLQVGTLPETFLSMFAASLLLLFWINIYKDFLSTRDYFTKVSLNNVQLSKSRLKEIWIDKNVDIPSLSCCHLQRLREVCSVSSCRNVCLGFFALDFIQSKPRFCYMLPINSLLLFNEG